MTVITISHGEVFFRFETFSATLLRMWNTIVALVIARNDGIALFDAALIHLGLPFGIAFHHVLGFNVSAPVRMNNWLICLSKAVNFLGKTGPASLSSREHPRVVENRLLYSERL